MRKLTGADVMSKRNGSACKACPSRRNMLKTGVAGVALAALPVACMSQGSPPNGPIAAGNVTDTAIGALKIFDGNAVLGRDANGLYAMSNVCTHQGCLMDVVTNTTPESLYCGCHGSAFNATGAVTRGPARAALPHYQVDVASDGSITIQAG
jgi:Rieske Fe-S protein